MVKRLFAIAFIFGCTTVAWLVLGGTLFERTKASGAGLRDRVSSTWGTAQEQRAPAAFVERLESRVVKTEQPRREGDRTATVPSERTEIVRHRIDQPLVRTRASVAFDLDHRQKGLMWYSTYGVAFDGAYTFRNDSDIDAVTLAFRLPAAAAVYDDLRVTVDNKPAAYQMQDQSIVTTTTVPKGKSVAFAVAYKSRGLDQWRYALGGDVAEVRDFDLVMHTDFPAIDFPDNTLSPSSKRETADGWELRWQYANLLSGFQIGMDMPQKLQPGPLAGEIALFAPVSLLFFFAAMFLVTTIRGIELHPMNYAFIAAGFFAFHLLLAYLVDHISIHLAFGISAAVSVALVVSYLRLAVGPAFAFREAALAQLLYLVLFSYAFFFKGFTGLAITIGSIVTLFVAMQLTGRVRWSELFAARSGSLARST